MPPEGLDWLPAPEVLTGDEIVRLIQVGVELLGIREVRFTGGEPLLQLDAALVDAVHANGFEIAVETNGTEVPVAGVDWLCVSPKAGAPLRVRHGQEIKLVYPQAGLDPAALTSLCFDHFWLQPMDGPDRAANTLSAITYCLSHPRWRLSVQMHKLVGIP
jgi:organic radical activating enzyme